MIIEKTIEYGKRLVLTEKRLRELDRLLIKYCDQIYFKARTKGKAEITFSGLEELVCYDNFKNGKLVNLSIWCSSSKRNTSISIEFAPTTKLHQETARCRYKFAEIEKETLFVKELNDFFDKATEAQTSYILCELITVVAILSFGIFSSRWLASNNVKQSIINIYWVVILCAPLIILFLLFWEKVFPPVIFPWGEEEGRYKKIKYIRQNLFWALLIPLVIAVIFGIIHL